MRPFLRRLLQQHPHLRYGRGRQRVRDGWRHLLGLHRRRGNLPGGWCVFGVGQFFRGIFVNQLVQRVLVNQLERILGRSVQDGRLRQLVRAGRLRRVLRSGRQLPPGHLQLELRIAEWLLCRLHDDEHDVRGRRLLVTTLRGLAPAAGA
jgi:hypothetical protein